MESSGPFSDILETGKAAHMNRQLGRAKSPAGFDGLEVTHRAKENAVVG